MRKVPDPKKSSQANVSENLENVGEEETVSVDEVTNATLATTSVRSGSQKDGEEDTTSVFSTPVRNIDDNEKQKTTNSVSSFSQNDGEEEDTMSVNTPLAKEVRAFNIE